MATSLQEHLEANGLPVGDSYTCPITRRRDAAFAMTWIADDPDFEDLGVSFISSVLYHQRTVGTALPAPNEVEGWSTDNEKANEVRAVRLQKLTMSDPRMAADYPQPEAVRLEWAAYRQALRDLPQTYADPESVVWPVAPSN